MKFLVSIRDEATELWGNPVAVNAKAEAVRAFKNAINNPAGDMARDPQDYNLFIIGTFNEETAEINPNVPQRLARGLEMITNKEPQDA